MYIYFLLLKALSPTGLWVIHIHITLTTIKLTAKDLTFLQYYVIIIEILSGGTYDKQRFG